MADPALNLDKECFFIAPIGPDGSEIRQRSDGVMQFIVSRAAEELGLNTVRADKIADPGQINLQVIDHVLQAKAAVADLTGLNPNVFYEMAVRHTAKMPLVIIAEKDTNLPFDIAQMRTIFFTHTNLQSADECRAGIVAQLRQALDHGIVDSPISTALDVSSLSSGSAIDRSVAELVTTVEDIARSQRELREAVALLRVPRQRSEISPMLLEELVQSMNQLRVHADATEDKELKIIMGGIERILVHLIGDLHRSRDKRIRETRSKVSDLDINSMHLHFDKHGKVTINSEVDENDS